MKPLSIVLFSLMLAALETLASPGCLWNHLQPCKVRRKDSPE
jgi:hypothetical protein